MCPQPRVGIPSFGTWNRTLRSALSICSSFLYWSRQALENLADAHLLGEFGVPKAALSGIYGGNRAVAVVLDHDPCLWTGGWAAL